MRFSSQSGTSPYGLAKFHGIRGSELADSEDLAEMKPRDARSPKAVTGNPCARYIMNGMGHDLSDDEIRDLISDIGGPGATMVSDAAEFAPRPPTVHSCRSVSSAKSTSLKRHTS